MASNPAAVGLSQSYAACHNAGVRSGDYSALMQLFAEGGAIEFPALPDGGARGRAAILRLFQDNGPDDELVVTSATGGDTSAVAPYSWLSTPDVISGALTLACEGRAIVRLTVTFGR